VQNHTEGWPSTQHPEQHGGLCASTACCLFRSTLGSAQCRWMTPPNVLSNTLQHPPQEANAALFQPTCWPTCWPTANGSF
jgi:hypothetical protein